MAIIGSNNNIMLSLPLFTFFVQFHGYISMRFCFQFALVHYYTKIGAGEYYLEELEETVCHAEEKLKERQRKAEFGETSVGVYFIDLI